jgi:hypothetical protein
MIRARTHNGQIVAAPLLLDQTTGCLKNDVSASVDGACLLNDADGPDGGLATMKSKLAGAAVLAAAGHA